MPDCHEVQRPRKTIHRFILFAKGYNQASIGAIALTEGLACETVALTAAVVAILLTAPMEAIAMDLSYKKLLQKECQNPEELID